MKGPAAVARERLSADVAIVGGGLAGCAAALFLRRRGLSVVLLEKDRVGAGASGVNFGGVRRQGRDPAELPLSMRAHAIWERLAAEIGIDGEFRPSGHLKLAYSEADMVGLEAYARTAATHGLPLELIGRNRLRDEHPWLSPEVVGGSLAPADGHANPRHVAPAFAIAARRAGADLREGEKVVASVKEGEKIDLRCASGLSVSSRVLVNCCGAWSGGVAAAFGETYPVEPIAPNAMVTEPVPRFMDRSIGICGGGVALRQTDHGSIVIGGGESLVDMVAGRARPLAEVCAAVLARAVRVAPALAGVQVVRAWAGVEGDMPDHVPVIGFSPTTPGLLHAFGFSQHGFQLGPAVGAVIAELIDEGETATPLAGLEPGRYVQAATPAPVDTRGAPHHNAGAIPGRTR